MNGSLFFLNSMAALMVAVISSGSAFLCLEQQSTSVSLGKDFNSIRGIPWSWSKSWMGTPRSSSSSHL